MIAVDTNILIYAHRQDSPWHDAARSALITVGESSAPWAIPWPCIHEFLGIVTHTKVFARPSTLTEAVSQIQAWRDSPALVLLSETETYWDRLRSLLVEGRIVGPVLHDARIFALCLDHGVDELWTADRDFSRFKGLRVRNPVI